MTKVTGNRHVQTPPAAQELNAGQAAAAPAAPVAEQQATGIDKLQVELPKGLDAGQQREARSLPAQSDPAALGQNKGFLGAVNLRASGTEGELSRLSKAADRFAAALAERGVTLAKCEARPGDPPSIVAQFDSRSDFDVARELLTSTRSGTPMFEGVVVDFRIGGLPPGA